MMGKASFNKNRSNESHTRTVLEQEWLSFHCKYFLFIKLKNQSFLGSPRRERILRKLEKAANVVVGYLKQEKEPEKKSTLRKKGKITIYGAGLCFQNNSLFFEQKNYIKKTTML